MEGNSTNKNQALDALFWKEEILQVLYWMEGEELGAEAHFEKLLALLNTSAANLLLHLGKNEAATFQRELPLPTPLPPSSIILVRFLLSRRAHQVLDFCW